MDYFSWYYRDGFKFYLRRWQFYFRWVVHFFSPWLLFKSLFSPWKRLVIEENVGWNPGRIFEKLTFNLVSRMMGFISRTFLIIFFLLAFLGILFLGVFGLVIWLFLPFLGLAEYRVEKNSLKKTVKELSDKIRGNPQKAAEYLFLTQAGRFILTHLNIDFKVFGNIGLKKENLENCAPQTFQNIATWFIEAYELDDEFFRQARLTKEDFLGAAKWWDERKIQEDTLRREGEALGRPGVGLELLFGYTPELNKYVVDLGAPQAFAHHLIGREEIVLRMERSLTSGSSVFVLGQPGVGKKTVVLEFAHRARMGLLGPDMSYRRVLELDYNILLSGVALDINLKKSKLDQLLDEASRAGNIILVIRDIHRLTNSQVEGYDFTDVFEKHLEKGDLKMIVIEAMVDYERFITTNPSLTKYFQPIEVVSPSLPEAMSILAEAAERWEKVKKIVILISSLHRILEGSDRYITETPFPEKALELLDQAVIFVERKGTKVMTSSEVDAVLSEKTGIPFAEMTQGTKDKLDRLEEIIHERLINQEVAVSSIAQTLRSSTVGAKDQSRPIGSFLFLGPTGVGKTQTAKVLAKVYFGSEKNILRFDMAEYAGSEGLARLIGSQTQNLPGAMTTGIKNRPASLLLLDEIEKATPEVMNLFLVLLDEGYLTDALGRKVNCQNLFVIATSNAAAEYIREQVNLGVKGEILQKAVIENIQRQGLFAPEFLNRFDGIVVYEPIKPEDLVKIGRLLLEELAANLKLKGIYLEITDEVCQKVAADGYEPAFGARPMRRVVELVIGDLLGKAILKGEIKSGDKIKITPGNLPRDYSWEKLALQGESL